MRRSTERHRRSRPRGRSLGRALLGALLLLPVVLGAAAVAGRAGPPPALQVEAVAAEPTPASEVVRLTSGGRPRGVLVQDPPGGAPATAVLVVLGPHALSAAHATASLRFDDLRARGWALAYPSTVAGDWNAGRCCGLPQEQDVDDVAFLRDVRELLLARYRLPADRLALAGYSTGGQMAYRTACEEPGYAGALLVVAGSLETDCAPDGVLPPTLVVHGTTDSTIPWRERGERLRLIDHTPEPGLLSAEAYAAAGGCGAPVVDRADGRYLAGWRDCPRLRSLTVAGMPGIGHVWDMLNGSLYASRFLPGALDA